MPRQIIVPRLPHTALTTPLELPGTAAWYDLSKLSSLIYDGSNRLQLVADVSGNSATNVACFPGSTGNYASSPDSVALAIAGDIELVTRINSADYTPTGSGDLATKYTTVSTQKSWALQVQQSGKLYFVWSDNGTNILDATSTVAAPFTDLATYWVKLSFDVDNGAAGNTAKFWYAADTGTNTPPSSWTQIGANVTRAGTTTINVSTEPVYIARPIISNFLTCNVFYFEIRNGIDGTAVAKFTPSTAAKLATSFVSATGETWTINTSGDTGARICGARDLVQMTQAKQPLLTLTPAGNYATFDGTDDTLASAPFPLAQPCGFSLVWSAVSWTSNDTMIAGSGNNSFNFFQRNGGVSPETQLFAGASACTNSDLAIGVRGLTSALFDGANSFIRVNKRAPVTGNPGTGTTNGITVGQTGNFTLSDLLVRNAGFSPVIRDRLASYFMPKWGITG